jgi:hypothetical protein
VAHEFGDSRDRDLGDDDRTSPSEEVTTGNPYHLSRRTRTLLRIVSVVLVISMTALFLQGFIHS